MRKLSWYMPWWFRVWFAELWVRKNEFHWTLDMDIDAMARMSTERRERYVRCLYRRRDIAHREDMDREDVLLIRQKAMQNPNKVFQLPSDKD